MKTTFAQLKEGNERSNSNEYIKQQISEILSTETSRKIFKPMSKRIEDRAIALLGKVLRKERDEPAAEVLSGDSNTWNIPRPKEGEVRDGKPRVNWAIETAKAACIKHEVYRGVGRGKNKGTYKKFDYTLKTHIAKRKDEAKQGNF